MGDYNRAYPVGVDFGVDVGTMEHVAGGCLHAFDDRLPVSWLSDGVMFNAVLGQDYSRRASPVYEYLPGWFEKGTYDRLQRLNPDAALMIGMYYGFKGQVRSGLFASSDWQAEALCGSGASWKRYIGSVMQDAREKNIRVFSWIPWNEPDAQWSGDVSDKMFQHYLTAYRYGYEGIKAYDARAKAQGPETCTFNYEWITSFLTYCKAYKCIPDILSWHELSPEQLDIEEHCERIYHWMLDNGITPRPLAVTAYQGSGYSTTPSGRRAEGNYNTGLSVSLLGNLERATRYGLRYGLRSEWGLDGSDPNALCYMGEMADFDTATMPTGLWYVYNEYWKMSGQKALTEQDTDVVDALAAINCAADRMRASVLVGNWDDNDKTVVLDLKGIPDTFLINGSVHVKADAIHETLATPSYGTEPLLDRDYAVTGGKLKLSLNVAGRSAIKVILSPQAKNEIILQAADLSPRVTGDMIIQNKMLNETPYLSVSGGKCSSYIQDGKRTCVESGDSVSFTLRVARDGLYNLRSNHVTGKDGGFMQLYIDGTLAGTPIDLYAAETRVKEFNHENIFLTAGPHRLSYRIVGAGKNVLSSGYTLTFRTIFLIFSGE